MVAAIQSAGKSEKFDAAADGLDELESLLEEGDVAESDGKDLQADPADKNVDRARPSRPSSDALGGKIKEAIARKNDGVEEDRAVPRRRANQLLQKGGKDSVDNVTKLVNKIEEMLGAAAVSTFLPAKDEARGPAGSSPGTRRSRRSPTSRSDRGRVRRRGDEKKAVAEAVESSASCRSSSNGLTTS